MGGLQNQIRLDGHSFNLERGQVGFGGYQPGLAGFRVAGAVLHEADFFGEHYAPGEAVAVLVPAHISGVGVVAQGHCQLDGDEQGQGDCRHGS